MIWLLTVCCFAGIFKLVFAYVLTFLQLLVQSSERTLDAPELVDDFYLNLLDWGSNNVLAIALSNTVYLWDASNGSTSELVTIDDEDGPVTSVSWAPDGRHIAIGLNNSHVQIWDSTTNRQVCNAFDCLLIFLLLFFSEIFVGE